MWLDIMSKKDDEEMEKASTLDSGGEAARLTVESGIDAGKEFFLNNPVNTIGRHLDNDVCLPHDSAVSRFHARISYNKDEGSYYYEDLNSTNGSKINGKLFRNERVKLEHGDRILIGNETQLRFFAKRPGLKDWIRG
jgi:pSer/pThr/pTyr-binding forkhead associated (FHA) protein